MSDRPVFKRFYRCEVLEPHGVLLLSERGQFVLRGRAYVLVAPFLDGRHSISDIVARLTGQLSEAEVLYAIELLERKGYVTRAGDSASPDRAAFWELLGSDAVTAADRLSGAEVSVRTFGRVASGPFRSMLGELGIRVLEERASAAGGRDPRAGPLVALVDDHLQEGLADLNREALSLGRPWMLVRPVGVEAWLGPVFVPGKTGCWACLEHRLSGHRKAERFLQERRGFTGPLVLARASLPSTVHAALALAATEVARWIVQGASESLEGKVVTLDALTLERRTHTLTRRPQCPSCGDPGLLAAAQRKPMPLVSCPVSFAEEGGYRRATPEETLAKNEHLVSPITGIVSHLKRLLHRSNTDLVPSYVADHNFAHADDDLFFLKEGQRSHSGGKGKSDAQARASALGEAIERFSGLYQGDEARVRARMADLGPAAIHPNEYMLFSGRQLAERERWNRSGSRYTRVPEPFDPSAEIDWSPVFPIAGGEPRYLPMACCYFGHGRKHDDRFAYADSNGCAAGLSREEALLQGLLELCERDATAVWWYNRVRRPGVDIASFGDPYYDKVIAYYETIHRCLWAIDLTHDLGIPTFAAVSRRIDKKSEDIIFGLGAHLDPKVALLRAVTELNQFLPAVFLVTAESEQYRWTEDGVRFFRTATLESEPYLAPDDSVPARTLSDFRKVATGDLLEDALHCVRALSSKGIEALALDQTRPDAGLSVVRVIAPGLRHFWARFAPGRLYDVPVRLGWLPRPLAEDDLNPIPIFF